MIQQSLENQRYKINQKPFNTLTPLWLWLKSRGVWEEWKDYKRICLSLSRPHSTAWKQIREIKDFNADTHRIRSSTFSTVERQWNDKKFLNKFTFTEIIEFVLLKWNTVHHLVLHIIKHGCEILYKTEQRNIYIDAHI